MAKRKIAQIAAAGVGAPSEGSVSGHTTLYALLDDGSVVYTQHGGYWRPEEWCLW